MTSYVENETDTDFSFDEQRLVSQVMEAVLEAEGCPYEASVNVLLTDDEGIREYNREYRGIDRATDVSEYCIWTAFRFFASGGSRGRLL